MQCSYGIWPTVTRRRPRRRPRTEARGYIGRHRFDHESTRVAVCCRGYRYSSSTDVREEVVRYLIEDEDEDEDDDEDEIDTNGEGRLSAANWARTSETWY